MDRRIRERRNLGRGSRLARTIAVASAGAAVASCGGARTNGAIAPLDAATRSAMLGRSWRPGCPIALSDLRVVTVDYWGFDGRPHVGRLVVAADVAPSVAQAFRGLFEHRFLIRRMRPIEAYGGDDAAAMADDDTSGFNCRAATGRPGVWSQHAYGHAVDINPVENPFVSGGVVSPEAGAAYRDRSARVPGMIHEGDAAVRAFESAGWHWGGLWSDPRDYQHFSAHGR